MKSRWTSTWYLMGRTALSRSTRGWWSGVIEATMAAILIVGGVILLVATVTSNLLQSSPPDFYSKLLYFALQPILAVAMIGIGGYMVFNALWKVGASEERRSDIVSRAGRLEFLNEIHRRRGDLPAVPVRPGSPIKGQRLPFRVVPSRRSLWGLMTAGVLCLLFVAIVAILVVTAWVKWKMGRTDWVAGMLAIPISMAAIWSFIRFVKQLLKLASVGPTVIELDSYPVVPGGKVRLFLSQSGRLRVKSLEVKLVCIEEATFNQGTNTLTQRRRVFDQRLFRKRGVSLRAKEPFETEITFCVPQQAMHSFQSSSNRVSWQIEVHGQISRIPKIERTFEIIVIPSLGDGAVELRRTSQLQQA